MLFLMFASTVITFSVNDFSRVKICAKGTRQKTIVFLRHVSYVLGKRGESLNCVPIDLPHERGCRPILNVRGHSSVQGGRFAHFCCWEYNDLTAILHSTDSNTAIAFDGDIVIYHCSSCDDPQNFEAIVSHVNPEEGPPTEYTFARCLGCGSIALFVREDMGDGLENDSYYRVWPPHSRHLGFLCQR